MENAMLVLILQFASVIAFTGDPIATTRINGMEEDSAKFAHDTMFKLRQSFSATPEDKFELYQKMLETESKVLYEVKRMWDARGLLPRYLKNYGFLNEALTEFKKLKDTTYLPGTTRVNLAHVVMRKMNNVKHILKSLKIFRHYYIFGAPVHPQKKQKFDSISRKPWGRPDLMKNLNNQTLTNNSTRAESVNTN